MASKAILTCRPNSHPFQERVLVLDQVVKVGRSVPKVKAAPNNAIFECKVLSRNHALLWYNNGKFYIQDTKSSNGTFLNNQRLSESGEESCPREVYSGDVVQFGVDVLESPLKVTHGCIIANIKLYYPDGKEAKPPPSEFSLVLGTHSLEDFYQLNQIIQESTQREQLLEEKLLSLQSVLEVIFKSADQGWKALVTEDKLLSKVENLENQIEIYSKDFTEDKMRDELKKLKEDKNHYQNAAKDLLHKVLEEKNEADKKYHDIKRSLLGVEVECSKLRSQIEKSYRDVQEIVGKLNEQVKRNEQLQIENKELEDKHREVFEELKKKNKELNELSLSKIETNSGDFIKESSNIDQKAIPKQELLIIENNLNLTEKDGKYQPHLSDEVQMKLVSQLQEITSKHELNHGLAFDSANTEDMNSTRSHNDGNKTSACDEEKELLRMQLDEAQLVAEQNKLMCDELKSQVENLKVKLALQASVHDNRYKDELNSSKQDCIRLEGTIISLQSEIKSLRELLDTKEKKDESTVKLMGESENNLINEFRNRIIELQEELVTVGTLYMECHEERTLVKEQLKTLKVSHEALLNKPYVFLTIAIPCLVAIFAFLFMFFPRILLGLGFLGDSNS